MRALALLPPLVVSCALLAACGQMESREATAAAASDPATDSIFDQLSTSVVGAIESDDPAAVASHFAPDGRYVPSGGTVYTGRQDIEAAYGQIVRVASGLQRTPARRQLVGDLGYEVGTFTQRNMIRGQTPVMVRGNYLIVLQKQSDGTWKIREQVNNVVAAQAEGAPPIVTPGVTDVSKVPPQ